MSSNDKPTDPMPIPAHRRNTFTGWPGTFFSPMATARPGGSTMGMSPPSGMPPTSTAHSFSGQTAMPAGSPPNDQAVSAFSGIGLFRRFSMSAASGGAPSSQQHPVEQAQQHLPEAFPANDFGFHKDQQHPRSKVLAEVMERDDPPSRPDSRMRNLMLSGQFMI